MQSLRFRLNATHSVVARPAIEFRVSAWSVSCRCTSVVAGILSRERAESCFMGNIPSRLQSFSMLWHRSHWRRRADAKGVELHLSLLAFSIFLCWRDGDWAHSLHCARHSGYREVCAWHFLILQNGSTGTLLTHFECTPASRNSGIICVCFFCSVRYAARLARRQFQ